MNIEQTVTKLIFSHSFFYSFEITVFSTMVQVKVMQFSISNFLLLNMNELALGI